MPGIIVRLHRASFQDVPVQLFGETITNDSGRFRFDVSPSNRYVLEFVMPEGFAATTPFVGTHGKDSDLLPSGFTRGFYAFGGDLTKDAGLVPASGQIGDRVWMDENNNGRQDDGEPSAPNVEVTLWQDVDFDGVVDYQVAWTMTGDNGRYLFTNVPEGNFAVQFEGPKFLQFSTPYATTYGRDSDVTPGAGRTEVFSVAENEVIKHIDAGMVVGGARLGDLVWDDENLNGTQDPGEPGLPYHAVRLWEDVDGDDFPDLFLQETRTNHKGKYRFNQLPTDKNLIVEFAARPRYGFVAPLAGGSAQLDSDAGVVSGRTTSVTLQPRKMKDDIDAGMNEVYSSDILFFGQVWDDMFAETEDEFPGDGLRFGNEPGFSDLPVYLYGDDFLTGEFKFIRTTYTGDDGFYWLRTTVNREIQIRMNAPDGKIFTIGNVPAPEGAFPSVIDPATGSSAAIVGQYRADIGLLDESGD